MMMIMVVIIIQVENTVEIICAACKECDVTDSSLLNFVVSDGHTLIATR